jgi:hypothetical protein
LEERCEEIIRKWFCGIVCACGKDRPRPQGMAPQTYSFGMVAPTVLLLASDGDDARLTGAGV